MKNNLFKLGMLIASMGVLVGCGGGNPTSSSSESKASETSQSTGLSSSEEKSSEEKSSEEKSSEKESSEEKSSEEKSSEKESSEEGTSEEGTSEEGSSEEGTSEEGSSGEQDTSEEAKTVYSLIGDFGGHNWDYDLDLVYDEANQIYVAEDVTFAIGNNWKIRVDHDWTTSYGYANLIISNDVNLEGCFVNADGNVNVAKAGTFTIYFDAVESKIVYTGKLDESQVEPEHEWGLIGLYGWDLPDDEIPFTKADEGWYVIEMIELTAEAKFKAVADHAWNINFGYSTLQYDEDLEGYFSGDGDGNVVVEVGGTFSISLIYLGLGNASNGLYISAVAEN